MTASEERTVRETEALLQAAPSCCGLCDKPRQLVEGTLLVGGREVRVCATCRELVDRESAALRTTRRRSPR